MNLSLLHGGAIRHAVDDGRRLGGDVRFRLLAHRQSKLQTIILVDAAGTGLDVKGRKARKVSVLELRSADMKGIGSVLTPQEGACLGIRRKFEFEPAENERSRRPARGGAHRFQAERAFNWQR